MDKEERAKIEQLSDNQVSYALNGIAKFYGFSDFEKAIFHEAVERLKSSWTHINPADPGTLPPDNTYILAAVRTKHHWRIGDKVGTVEAFHTVQSKYELSMGWCDSVMILPAVEGEFAVSIKHYAWQHFPTPPPFLGTADNQENEER